MPLACFGAISNVTMLWKHAEGMSLRYGAVIFGDLTHPQREDRNGGEMVAKKSLFRVGSRDLQAVRKGC